MTRTEFEKILQSNDFSLETNSTNMWKHNTIDLSVWTRNNVFRVYGRLHYNDTLVADAGVDDFDFPMDMNAYIFDAIIKAFICYTDTYSSMLSKLGDMFEHDFEQLRQAWLPNVHAEELTAWDGIPKYMTVWNDGGMPVVRMVKYFTSVSNQWMCEEDGHLVGYQHALPRIEQKNPTKSPDFNKKIYAIQVLANPRSLSDARTIGWYDTYEMAHDALVGSSDAVSDNGYYKYALIEGVPMGLYGGPACDYSMQWFKLEINPVKTQVNDYIYVETENLGSDGVVGYTMG